MTARIDAVHARALLVEAARRRHQPGFHATLMQWAANARKRLAEKPVQRELFA